MGSSAPARVVSTIVPPTLNRIKSGALPAAQSPPVISLLLLALSTASRSVHKPSPCVLLSASVLTVMVLMAGGGPPPGAPRPPPPPPPERRARARLPGEAGG